MSFDNVLFAVTIAGIVLSLAYFRAAYLMWRFEKARDLRRVSGARALQRSAMPPTLKRACTVLDFKDACARKARQAAGVDAGAKSDTGMEDSRQRSGGKI